MDYREDPIDRQDSLGRLIIMGIMFGVFVAWVLGEVLP